MKSRFRPVSGTSFWLTLTLLSVATLVAYDVISTAGPTTKTVRVVAPNEVVSSTLEAEGGPRVEPHPNRTLLLRPGQTVLHLPIPTTGPRKVLSLDRLDLSSVAVEYSSGADRSPLIRLETHPPAFVLPDEIGVSADSLQVTVNAGYPGRLHMSWWNSVDAFQSVQRNHAFIIGAYLGALAILLLLNFFIFLTTRHTVYRDYSLFLLFHGLSTIAYEGLYLATPLAKTPGIQQALLASIPLSLFWVLGFTRRFLDLARSAAAANRTLVWIQRAFLLLLIQLPLLATPEIWELVIRAQTALALLAIGAVLLLGLRASWRGGWPQRLFLLAFIPHAFAAGGFILSRLGLTGPDPNFYYKLIFGSIVEMTVLALALAVQIRQVEQERRAALEASLRAMKKNQDVEARYRDRLESEVTERTRDLRFANQEKSRLLSVLAHDLRSPLNSIVRISEFALRQKNRPQEAYEILGSIQTTGRALFDLLDNLLAWARLNWGQLEPRLEAVEFDSVQDRALALFQAEIDRRELQWRRTGLAGHRGVTDRDLLQTVLRNLFANVVRHAPRGSRVECHVEAVGSDLHLSLANEGPDIPAAALARLQESGGVEALDRGSPDGSRTGLGLLLCRDAVEMLEGHLSFGHRPGFGPEVTIELPFPAQ